MLTADVSTASRAQPTAGHPSWPMTLRAWVPALRGLPLPTIAGLLAMALAPTAITLSRGGDDLSGALVAAAVISATSVAFTVDDPAGETLSASPTSLARRRALRLSAIVLALGLTWAALVAVTATLGPIVSDDLLGRAAEAAAVSGVAVATAGLAHRRGIESPSLIGGVAGGLSSLLITSLALRLHELPALMSTEHHGRWWLVALAGWVVGAWTWRDPTHH